MWWLYAIVGIVSWIVAVIGFAQIIGSLQNLRSNSKLWFTLIIWIALIAGSYFLMKAIVPEYKIAYFIGMGIGLLQILFSGKIQ